MYIPKPLYFHLMKTTNKYTNSVEEHLANLAESAPKKKKPNKAREEKLLGFQKLADDEEVALVQSDLKTEFQFPDRDPSLLKLFLYHFDVEFIDLLIQENLELTEINQLPPVFWNPAQQTRRRDLDIERRRLVLKFVATRLYIMSNPTKKLKGNWPIRQDLSHLYIARDPFRLMLSNMLIRLNMVEALNERLARYIKSGRHVMIDEKHKGTNREQHLARWVHGKDPNWGHWITEATTIGPYTGMPILIKLMPLTSTEPRNVTLEPYNNLSLVDVHREIAPTLAAGTFIVEDAYYLDDQSRTYLREQDIKYLSAINPIRFAEVWEVCEKFVQKKGDWVIMESKTTNEHAMMRWDPMGERKQYVITNAFETRKKLKKKSPDINAISETYKLLFNGCDRFNNLLNTKYWPYDRNGWQANFDDFFFSSIILNIYVSYHEVFEIETKMSFETFSLKLSKKISKYAQSL
jgi:hypothetical protein